MTLITILYGSCAVPANSAVLSKMNENPTKPVIGSVKPKSGGQEVNTDSDEVARRFGVSQCFTEAGVPRYGFISSAIKEWCADCGCYIRAEGHELRCRKPSERPKGWSIDRERAWFGDLVHKMDVQVALVLSGERSKSMVLRHAEYIPSSAMRV